MGQTVRIAPLWTVQDVSDYLRLPVRRRCTHGECRATGHRLAGWASTRGIALKM
jgi:hypothetical protein